MKTIFLILFIITMSYGTMAQTQLQSVVATGGGYNVLGKDMNISWTIGESSIQTLEAENVFTQGFHQPFPEAYLAIIDPGIKGLSINVYPNPASSVLFLAFEANRKLLLKIQIYDVKVQELTVFDFDTTDLIYSVDLKNYASGMYYVSVTDTLTGNKIIFKFIKN